MFFLSSNYKITSSLCARSTVNPEQWWIHLKQILKWKDLQPIIIDWLTNPVNKITSFPLLTSYNNTNSWSNKLRDMNFLIERKGNASLYHILFSNTPHRKQMKTESCLLLNPIGEISLHKQNRDPHREAHDHCKMCTHCSIQSKKKNYPQPQWWLRSSHWMNPPYHLPTL